MPLNWWGTVKYYALLFGIGLAIGGLTVWLILRGRKRHDGSGAADGIDANLGAAGSEIDGAVTANTNLANALDDSATAVTDSQTVAGSIDATNQQITDLTHRARAIVAELQRRKRARD